MAFMYSIFFQFKIRFLDLKNWFPEIKALNLQVFRIVPSSTFRGRKSIFSTSPSKIKVLKATWSKSMWIVINFFTTLSSSISMSNEHPELF